MSKKNNRSVRLGREREMILFTIWNDDQIVGHIAAESQRQAYQKARRRFDDFVFVEESEQEIPAPKDSFEETADMIIEAVLEGRWDDGSWPAEVA